ncbi:MAG: glutamate racemase [Burkholderiales bacterium]|nr:glutamate racemase [Burkholderiales bacterium]
MPEEVVGIFDSGLGGLSILKAVRQKLPLEDIVYVGDCLNAPYGDKSKDFITDRVRKICQFFLDKKAKAVVIACNTATAASIDKMRQEMDIPFIGVEPGIKPAVAMTKTKSIGVMATRSTVGSDRYRKLLEKYNPHGEVVITSSGCSGLMQCVERGEWDSPGTASLIHKYVQPFKEANADIVVLGCTHYPFLKKAIQAEAGRDVILYDPSPAVAEELKRQLAKVNKLKVAGEKGQESFYLSGLNAEKLKTFDLLWNPYSAVVQPFTL